MSKRNTKKEERLEEQADDIELHNTFNAPIESGRRPSPYDVPREDRASSPHTFASDVDQQKMIAQLKSEVFELANQVRSLAKRVDKLEKA